jgi:uroporphyrinogen decarboxylase
MFSIMVAPYMEERIRHTRLFTDAAFFHHTCGAVRPLIPELIRIGVDILNPIQPRATGMEPARLKADFGADLTLYGGVDTQELLPFATAEGVRHAVHDLVGVAGVAGGFVLAPAHCILAQVPEANVIAMYREGARIR